MAGCGNETDPIARTRLPTSTVSISERLAEPVAGKAASRLRMAAGIRTATTCLDLVIADAVSGFPRGRDVTTPGCHRHGCRHRYRPRHGARLFAERVAQLVAVEGIIGPSCPVSVARRSPVSRSATLPSSLVVMTNSAVGRLLVHPPVVIRLRQRRTAVNGAGRTAASMHALHGGVSFVAFGQDTTDGRDTPVITGESGRAG